MKFFLLFSSTPLPPSIPLKALTSQGKRLDVACRMLRACTVGPDGCPSGHHVAAWFAGDGKLVRSIELHVDGHALDQPAILARFRSELVLARYLAEIVSGIARENGTKNEDCIHARFLDAGMNAEDSFLEAIRREQVESGTEIILLHENGTPILDFCRPGMLEWKQVQAHGAAIVIGDHNGFPVHVERTLLRTSDRILCITKSKRDEHGVGDAKVIPYLGSHVAAFVQMFSIRGMP
ncbi:MAG: hypothetical protein GYA24_02255 [Candidatus Lokiarchaeota archaeon]|nr:hypothetical protein [Candidatus Lokiarchaeota archaeon]